MKTPVTQRSPCYSAVSALLMNPLPDHSNYSSLCHTHYLTPDQFTSLFGPDPLPSRELETNIQSSQFLEEAEQQAEASVDVPYPPLQIVNSAPFSLSLSLQCLPKIKTYNLITPHAQRERGKVIGRGVHIYICGRKKNLNRTLEIDSPFQTLTVGLLVEFID